MSTRLEIVAAELEALRSEIATLDALEVPTDDEAARFDVAVSEWDAKKAEHDKLAAKMERVEAIRSASLHEPNREVIGAPEVIVSRTDTKDPYEGFQARSDVMTSSELRSRALDAVEQAPEHMTDDQRERATRLIELDNKHAAPIARHLLATGSPVYHDEFKQYVRSGGQIVGDQMRAALSLTDANGGYLVPFTLDPTIILTNDGTANPWRAAASVKTITTDSWQGVSSAGVTAEWLAEGSQAADASPTFAQPAIPVHKAAAYVFGSYEVLADSDFASEVGGLIADGKDRLEGTAFAVGSGSGQPTGVVTQLVADSKTVASAGSETFARADVDALMTAVPPRHRARGSWFAGHATIDRIRAFDTNGGSAFWANLGGANPELLKGRPIYESSDIDTSITAAAENYMLVFGDMSQYYIVDRVGMTLMYEPMVKGANQRPTGQAGWFAFWRVGAEFANSNAARVLNVT